jgi:effector-binding domain-containing protein
MPCLRLAALLLAGLALAASPAAAQPAPAPAPTGPAVPAPLQPGDAFGQEVTLPERTVIYFQGEATWDKAFASLLDAYKSLTEYLDKQGIKPTGPAMTIYTDTSDTGFKFHAAFPIDAPPKDPPKGDIAVGVTPSGKALKFVHRGSYDAMDSTYEAITNYLDDKQLESRNVLVEEYETDILKTPAENLVVTIYVPLK